MIDIYEKEDLRYALLVFIMGALSVFVVWGIQWSILIPSGFEINGNFLNDFLYCVFAIGAVEEFAKLIPFLVFYRFFKREVNEPIDVIFYCSVSALGFAAVENVLYFMRSGPSIIDGRAILSVVTHMFSLSIVAYGIIRYRYFHRRKDLLGILGYFLIASLSHGFYDFWLLFEPFRRTGWVVSFGYFLITISIFAGIINNALNNSRFFTYEKVILSGKVTQRLITYYGIIFFIQAGILAYQHDLMHAFKNFRSNLFLVGLVVMITSIRLGRFTLVPKEWQPIPFEFPFALGGNPRIRIKGNPFEDVLANTYFRSPLIINPLSRKSRGIKHRRRAIASRKLWFEDGEPAYLLRVEEDRGEPEKFFLIKAKIEGETHRGQDPIVHVMQILDPDNLQRKRLNKEVFPLIEWAYLQRDQSYLSIK